ncbi:unnamed protein product, partial [Symbiodinium sp. KB8]
DASEDWTVDSLRQQAQKELGVGIAKLFGSDTGEALEGSLSVGDAELSDGSVLAAGVRRPQIASSRRAFAMLCTDGTVVAWGDPCSGGDCSGVSEKLQDVQHIYASWYSFAALLGNGDVVTWGDEDHGGDCSAAGTLKKVRSLRSTHGAFAALMGDGSVVTWGSPEYGGRGTPLPLTHVRQIEASGRAFAAIRTDGSVTTWGDPAFGGDSDLVKEQLHGVCDVKGSWRAFAALREDGSVVAWGHPQFGADCSEVNLEGEGAVAQRRPLGCFRECFCSYTERPICRDLGRSGVRRRQPRRQSGPHWREADLRFPACLRSHLVGWIRGDLEEPRLRWRQQRSLFPTSRSSEDPAEPFCHGSIAE